MSAHAQPLPRSARTERVTPPPWGTPQETALAVLYLPSPARDRSILRDRMARAGAVVTITTDLADAVQMLGTREFGLVVVDLGGERVARATIRLMHAQFPETPICGVIDPAQPLAASEAVNAGVADLLTWPCDDADVAAMLVAARDAAPAEVTTKVTDVEERLFHQSPSMRPVMDAIKSAGGSRTTVLISGEPGSGRSLVARTIHDRVHDYVNRPFIVIDCGETPLTLEHRIFGTSSDTSGDPATASGEARAERAARGSAVLAAQGGTLFLKNIQDAPSHVQDRLARLLSAQRMLSVDVDETVTVTFRAMASTDTPSNVEATIAEDRLRVELVNQLGLIRIDVPGLRRRREDLPLLAAHFLHQACEEDGRGSRRFSRAALTLLTALPWNGNARELRDVIVAAVADARGPIIPLESVLEHARMESGAPAPVAVGGTLRDARETFERECISATLMRHGGRVSETAKALGIQRTNLYRKVRQLNVPRALLSPQK